MIGRVGLLCALALFPMSAFAQLATPKDKPHCEPLVKAEADFAKFIAPDKAQFTKVTPGQFHFLQGVAAINPQTPPGLPPGTSAILAMGDRASDGVVLFVLNGKMCLPMEAPKMLIELMGKILTDRLDTEGDEM